MEQQSTSESSRLDAAKKARPDGGGEWYRSPLALVAAGILFLGAVALVALNASGTNNSGTAAGVSPFPAATSAAISFGGLDVPEVDAVAIVGDALPLRQADNDPAVGTLAPEITATSMASGTTITLGPGRARVIGFFAHWCGVCQAELPEVTEWLANTQLPPNTEFIAISTRVDDSADNFPPSAWFTDVGFNSPVLIDDAESSLLNGFGFTGFPSFVAIDASGVVVARESGNIGTEGVAALFANFAS